MSGYRRGGKPCSSERGDQDRVLDVMRAAAKVAAAEALRILKEGRGGEEHGRGSSGDISLLGDIVAEKSAISYLQEKLDDFRVVSEELGEKSFGSGGEYTFIIDPIDGSRNYKRGVPLFAVSIAVARGETLEDTFAGVVYAPLLNQEFYAVKGGGAYLNGRRLEVKSACGDLPGKVVAVSSPPKASFLPSLFILKLATYGAAPRIMGSASLELSMVASGGVDAYIDAWGTMRVIDVAAAELIAREAGAFSLIGGKENDPPSISLKERLYILVAASKGLAEKIASVYEESFGYKLQELFKVMRCARAPTSRSSF